MTEAHTLWAELVNGLITLYPLESPISQSRFPISQLSVSSNSYDLKQTHLQSQLAQLSANLADTENLLRMTSVQAGAMRGLGSWHGGM